MTDKKLVTTHVYPPIPPRDFDWCAHWDGEEETATYGWGKTEQEAITDLRRIDQERAEEQEERARASNT